MRTCPACGVEVDDARADCPRCHLSVALFEPVREAAGPGSAEDPVYLRTIGELLATAEGLAPHEPAGSSGSPSAPAEPTTPASAASNPPRSPEPPTLAIGPTVDLPALPRRPPGLEEMKQRLTEYFGLGRRLGLDFTDFAARANSAALVDDADSLEILAREMFVHLSSAIVEEYEACLARRNELAPIAHTASADVELAAVRRAIGVGDLNGAQRRLGHVRDELGRIEEQWEVGRILVTEGELMTATIRELGGDPTPATGPLEEGRRLFADGRRAESEAVLARANVALWTLLEPLLIPELRRLRNRMGEARSAGLDVVPAVRELRAMSGELKKRNFAGMIVAYRRLRSAIERVLPAGVEGLESPAGPEARTVPPS